MRKHESYVRFKERMRANRERYRAWQRARIEEQKMPTADERDRTPDEFKPVDLNVAEQKQRMTELDKLTTRLHEIKSQKVWSILEALQGDIAAEIRGMLGEAPYSKAIFTPEDRQRRIQAMQQCAALSTSDSERHDSWMKMHQDGGWVYGEQFDPAKKTHPNMKPWDELPTSTRSKARIFDLVAKAGLALTKS